MSDTDTSRRQPVPRWLADFFDNPVEGAQLEAKTWLDPADKLSSALLALAVAAMANTGGGHVVLGAKEVDSRLVPDDDAKAAYKDAWTHDYISSRLAKMLEPCPEVAITRVRSSDHRWDVLAVSVPACDESPVLPRKGSSDNNKTLNVGRVYVRTQRAGGGWSSAEPQSVEEWRSLIRRLVVADKDSLLADIRSIVAGQTKRDDTQTVDEAFRVWIADCRAKALRLATPAGGVPVADLPSGSFEVAYRLEGGIVVSDLAALLALSRQAKIQDFSGWPLWVVITNPESQYAPKPIDDGIEMHSNDEYWRLERDGWAYAIRPYPEDEDGVRTEDTHQRVLDPRLQLHHVFEAIAHAHRMAKALGAGKIHLVFRWTGLHRRAFASLDRRYHSFLQRTCHQDAATMHLDIERPFNLATLPQDVTKATAPVLSAFDFFDGTSQLVEQVWTDQRIAPLLREWRDV